MIAFIIYKAILVGVVFGVTLFVAAYSTYAERKVAAFCKIVLGQTVRVHSAFYNP